MEKIVINLSLFVFLFAIPSLSFSSTMVMAKKDTLVGLIVNKNGKGISNVPVSVKNEKDMVRTDRKGIFVILGEDLPDSVTIMLPSKKIFHIPVKGGNFIKITTNESSYSVVQARDEIVNIGYGNSRQSRTTTGELAVSGDDLRETGERNIIMALAGKVPGLSIIYNDNGTTSLRIRGGTSFAGSNEPLYVVDGIIVDDIRHISLNYVEKVAVLKDGGIYGARGANGVIIVTTKR